MANTEDKGNAEINADTEGEGKVRIDGSYLAQALKACGGMVDFKVTNAYSPMLFTADGYELVVMPMMTNEASEAMKRDKEQAEPEAEGVSDEPTEAEGEAEAKDTEPKPKRSRKREKVAVA